MAPLISKLPPVMLPVTDTDVNVPTEVILGCALVVTVPAVVADVADVALATVPVTLAPGIDESPAPDPMNVLAVTLPVADTMPLEIKLPVVMLPVADTMPPVIKLPACVLPVALNTPALILPATTLPVVVIIPDVIKLPTVALPVDNISPDVRRLPACTLAVTANDVNVPTLVMLGCAASVTVLAVAAVPVMLMA